MTSLLSLGGWIRSSTPQARWLTDFQKENPTAVIEPTPVIGS